MATRARYLVAFVGMLPLTSCEGVVERHLVFEAEDGFPTGHSDLDDGVLTVHLDRIESPSAGRGYTVWGRGEAGWTRLGPVPIDAPVMFSGPMRGISWEDIDEVVVGEEPAALPTDTPELPIHFRGPPGEELTFGGVEPPAHEVIDAVVMTAVAVDADLELTALGLPELSPDAAFFAWLRPEHHEWDSAIPLGPVEPGDTMLSVPKGIIAAAEAVTITVEIVAGSPEPATQSEVFVGEMLGSAEAPAEEEPSGHGDHVH